MRGFEDASELILSYVERSATVEEVRRRIRYLLGLVKQRKYQELERQLEVL